MNRTTSQRIIWAVAGTCVLLGLLAFALRANHRATTNPVEPHAAPPISEMLTALEFDARVRRPATRRLVETVSAHASHDDTGSAEIHYALGLRYYYGENNRDAARVAFEKSIALGPEWSWPHNALAIVLYVSGDETLAKESWENAMALAPKWSRPHSDMGILYRRAGHMDAAEQALRTALNMDPENPVPHYNYGVFLDITLNHEAARARYLQALSLYADLPSAHYNLACSYGREGDLENALPYLREAIKQEPAFREDAGRDPDFDPIRDQSAFADFLVTR